MKPVVIVLFYAFAATLYPLHASASLAGHGGHGCHASGHSSGHSGHSSGHSGGHSSGHGSFHGHGSYSRGGQNYGPSESPWHAFERQRRLETPLKGVSELTGNIGAAGPMIVPAATLRMTAPSLFTTFRYHVSKQWAIDFAAGVNTFWGKDTCFCTDINENGQAFDYRINALSFQTGVTWIAYSVRNWQLYSSLLAGVTYFTENDEYADGSSSWIDGYRFTMHFTAFGIRYGKQIGAFAELGYGVKGVLNGGLSWQMEPRKHGGTLKG